jgi:hypothetical protein
MKVPKYQLVVFEVVVIATIIISSLWINYH